MRYALCPMLYAMHTWEVWYPKAAATGLLLARGRLDPTDTLLMHAAPDFITVEVRDEEGARLAFAQDLPRTLQSPMCLLRRDGSSITREDLWPGDNQLGLTVLL